MKQNIRNNQTFFLKRINILFIFFLFLGMALTARYANLQIFHHRFSGDSLLGAFNEPAGNQVRGEIFLKDRTGALTPLAINKDFFTIFANTNLVEKKEETANALADVLALPQDVLLQKLTKHNDPYEVLAQRVTEDIADKVKALPLKGIGLDAQKGRYYPYQNSAAHLTGFLGISGDKQKGQYGLEAFYEDDIKVGGTVKQLVLSVDPHIQYIIEAKLKEAVEKWQAHFGTAIVMEPATGRILGLAGFPDFNPNEYAKVPDVSLFTNKAISAQFELGSVFKPVTMAAGLNEKVVTPDTIYTDTGVVRIGQFTIKNWDLKVHGVNTMTEVLEHSLNTGVVFVEEKMSKDVFRSYIKQFGFGEKTGIDLQGEVSGDIRNLNHNRDVEFATASFGQGISMTPLQMTAAIAAIANNGTLMQPHLVDEIFLNDGSDVIIPARKIREVISPDSAQKLTKMLVSTVVNGYDKAKIPGYFIAGKTGTAQIANAQAKGYADDATIQSFAGYAPAYHPQFVVFLSIDSPQGVRFASESLTSSFADIMSYLLTYYEIPPDFKINQ